MKSRSFLLLLIVFLLTSCHSVFYDDKCAVVFSNNSSFSFEYITDIYYCKEGSTDWVSAWNGSLEKDGSTSIFIPTGKYMFKIDTLYLILNRTYSTGYKNYITVADDASVFINFDGSGIYQK